MMASVDALVGGGFALAGVAVQQLGSGLFARAAHRRERSARLLSEKREVYARLIVAARIVQRMSKDQAAGVGAVPDPVRVEECLGVLAQVNSEVRLLGPPHLVALALAWEDSARRRMTNGEFSVTDELRIGPLIAAMRQDLPFDAG
ncbi:hypothetical protein ACWDGI_23215 [Streptomyces sp. NPDC001220]